MEDFNREIKNIVGLSCFAREKTGDGENELEKAFEKFCKGMFLYLFWLTFSLHPAGPQSQNCYYFRRKKNARIKNNQNGNSKMKGEI